MMVSAMPVIVVMIVRMRVIVAVIIVVAVWRRSHRGVALRSNDAADMGESASEYYYILATLPRIETKASPRSVDARRRRAEAS
jgi:hypothetical protein